MTTAPTDALLHKILTETKTIAVVGVSTNPVRPSYFVMRYLHMRNYRLIPINPAYAGQTLFGQTILASIKDIPAETPVDMLDIFRRPEFVSDLVDDAITHLGGRLKTIWMQIGVEHAGAARRASEAGLQMVQNRCPKIEYQRLFGELRRAGFNTGIISSKLPRL
ncbi:MAG: CoA-binding protein [Rhodobacterales bacterium]